MSLKEKRQERLNEFALDSKTKRLQVDTTHTREAFFVFVHKALVGARKKEKNKRLTCKCISKDVFLDLVAGCRSMC